MTDPAWRAVTIKHPWALAVADGIKPIENRKRGFPRWHRGLVMIHAGAGWSKRGAADDRIARWWGDRLGFTDGFAVNPMPNPDFFVRKAVIAVAELADVHEDGGCCRPWGESGYTESHGVEVTRVLHLVFEDVVPLTAPVAAKGQLGLWTPGADLIEAVVAAMP